MRLPSVLTMSASSTSLTCTVVPEKPPLSSAGSCGAVGMPPLSSPSPMPGAPLGASSTEGFWVTGGGASVGTAWGRLRYSQRHAARADAAEDRTRVVPVRRCAQLFPRVAELRDDVVVDRGEEVQLCSPRELGARFALSPENPLKATRHPAAPCRSCKPERGSSTRHRGRWGAESGEACGGVSYGLFSKSQRGEFGRSHRRCGGGFHRCNARCANVGDSSKGFQQRVCQGRFVRRNRIWTSCEPAVPAVPPPTASCGPGARRASRQAPELPLLALARSELRLERGCNLRFRRVEEAGPAHPACARQTRGRLRDR